MFTNSPLLSNTNLLFFADHRSSGPLGKDTRSGHWQTGDRRAKKFVCKCCKFFFQTYRTGDMAWWEQIADFWWGEGWEEWMVISIKRNPYFREVDKCHQTSSFPQHDHHQIVAFSFSRQPTNSFKIILVPCQGGLLWRLAWYLRFFLPNYYGEHTHGEEKNQI